MEEEEARRKKLMELDEAERLRVIIIFAQIFVKQLMKEEEEERKRKLEEDIARRKAKAESMRNSKNAKVTETFTDQKKIDNDINIKGDPLEHNDGDIDLEQYLKPLLAAAGGNIEKLALEALRRALSDGTLLVVGVKLWTALHSDAWRHREAAA